MPFCTKCGTEIAEGQELCTACQNPAPATNPVPQTAPEVQPEVQPVVQPQAYAEAPVGTPVTPVAPVNNGEYMNSGFEASEPEKKKSSKKGVIIGVVIAVVALLAAAVAAFFLLGKGEKVHNYTLYVKDGGLYYTELKKIEPQKISDDVVEYTDDFEESVAVGPYIDSYINFSSDYKTVYYPREYTNEDYIYVFDLVYQNMADDETASVKVDSDVRAYKISEDGKTIIYTKDDGESTVSVHKYTADTQAKDKLFDSVSSVDISDDLTKILFINDDDNLYIYDVATENKEKIDTDVSSVEYYDGGLSVVYYVKEAELFKKESGKDKEKIASDVSDVIHIYETGEVYYLTKEEESIPYSALITDDKLAADEKIGDVTDLEVNYSNFEYFKNHITKNYGTYCRFYLRKEIKGQKIEKTLYSLHYVSADGKEDEIATNVTSNHFYFNYDYALDKAVIAFNSIDMEALGKLKISEIDFGTINDDLEESKEDVEIFTILRETLEKNYLDSHVLKVAVGGTVTDVDAIGVYDAAVSDDGSEIYYINYTEEETKSTGKRDYDAEWSKDVYYFEDGTLYLNPSKWGVDYKNEDEGELFKITVGEDAKVAKPVSADKEVNLLSIYYRGEDGNILSYYKCYDEEADTVDLYVNGESVADDINRSTVVYISESEIYYLKDYDEEDCSGTLVKFNGEDEETIADDVYTYAISDGGDILFISDYRESKSYGSYYIYRDGEKELIDDDVTAIVPTNGYYAIVW